MNAKPRRLDVAACQRWCRDRGVNIDISIPTGVVMNGSSEVARIVVTGSAPGLVALANMLVLTGSDGEPDGSYPGGLIFFLDTGLWSETIDRVGWRLLGGLHNGYGTSAAVDFEGLEVGAGDEIGAQSAIALALLFQWDAYYFPASGRYVFRVSHEGYIDAVAVKPDLSEHLLSRLSGGPWEVQRLNASI